ncbi:MAG TPA: S9 family peptidase [Gaiellaceae bacterium]|nr:S9 family peptidase [Gaiellaceae bacterium]
MAGMQPDDVYELTGVGSPRISPDGSRVAYEHWWVDREEGAYRGAIWVAPLDGSGEPRRFTSGEKRDGQPRWSPDGRLLAFTSNRGGDKSPPQLYVMPADGGEARKLTDGKEGVESFAWSPDSSRIAFARRVRDEAYEEEDDSKRAPRRFRRVFYKLDSVGWTGDRRKHLFVVDLDGSERQVTDGDYEDADFAWTPDGRRLLFSALRSENWDTELISRFYEVEVDAEGAEPRQLTGDDASFGSPSWSPDGSRLAFHWEPEDGTDPHHTQIGVMNADGSDWKLLTASLDRQCGPFPLGREPVWDGDRIWFTLEDGGNVHLYSVPADGSAEPTLELGGEQVVGLFDVRDGTVVYAASTHTRPMELFAGDGTQLTDVSKGFREGRELVEAERFTAVSKDGTEVDAWLVRPAGFEEGKRYPALLSIHGGPFTQYSTGFFDEFQVYAGGGYAVIFCNPRGGSGYTEAWGRAIRGPLGDAGPGWGTVDYEDCMAAVDSALERFDFIDPERLGVLGGSYGGYMTSWIVGHTNRFKAALSERAVNNLVSMFGSSDLFWVFEQQFGGPMWENVQAYLDKSPSSYAQQVETPVLVVHSENDLRCNIEQGEHLFQLLRLLGKEVEMLRFPAESHELTRGGSPTHRVQRFEAVLEWFGRYLSPGS